MKQTLFFLTAFLCLNNVFAQSKAVLPMEPAQYVQNIIQELDIPDETFDEMRGKDYMVQLKLFLNNEGKVIKTALADDVYNLQPLIAPIVEQMPNFTPLIVDGVAKNSMYKLSFVLNEYSYFKLVRQKAVPTIGMEKFLDRVRNSFYLSQAERANLSAAKTKENYDVVVDFIIEKDGSLCCFKMQNKEMEYFEDRMIRAVKRASKKWTPGKLDGKTVRTKFTITLTMKLDFHSLNI